MSTDSVLVRKRTALAVQTRPSSTTALVLVGKPTALAVQTRTSWRTMTNRGYF